MGGVTSRLDPESPEILAIHDLETACSKERVWLSLVKFYQKAEDTRPISVVSGAATSLYDRIIGRSQIAAGRLRVRSALNPMLWLCVSVALPCLILAWVTQGAEPLSTILTWLGAAPIAVTCLASLYFTLFSPEKLQSEDYQIRHETLDLIKQKGIPIELSASSVASISNPSSNPILNVDHDGAAP